MNRITHALGVLYGAASIALVYCAVISHRAGSAPYTVLLACCAVLFGLAVVHHTYHHDELRAALKQLETLSRPRDQRPAIDGVIAVAMAGWCCDTAVLTAGANHDPDRCTRKDQTT
ncbi:hypothetical protein AB9Q10_16305 [Streptomyces krungchingensis]|uniref:hypothetical protein n=1 Tax=Streptomyces krungchingensis TaxID=1565034 RepID=UPI003CF013AA